MLFHLQIYGKISKDGVFLEQLETNPAQYLPDVQADKLGGDVVKVGKSFALGNSTFGYQTAGAFTGLGTCS